MLINCLKIFPIREGPLRIIHTHTPNTKGETRTKKEHLYSKREKKINCLKPFKCRMFSIMHMKTPVSERRRTISCTLDFGLSDGFF